MTSWLIDTGPLIAYLDADDRFHDDVASCLDAFAGRLVCSSAVITEAVQFVSAHRNGPRVLAELVRASGMMVYDLCSPPELTEAAALMEKYSDTPMDFADATLVLLAEGLGVTDILTLDRRGFTVFRTRDGRALRMVLDAQ